MNANISLIVQVPSGPAVTAAWTVTADAFDQVSAACPASTAGTATKLLLTPTAAAEQVIVLTASGYATAADPTKLTYKFFDGTTGGTARNFTEPIALVGSTVTAAASGSYAAVEIVNKLAAPVTVNCFLLRTAV